MLSLVFMAGHAGAVRAIAQGLPQHACSRQAAEILYRSEVIDFALVAVYGLNN
jgi:hypothetical protein